MKKAFCLIKVVAKLTYFAIYFAFLWKLATWDISSFFLIFTWKKYLLDFYTSCDLTLTWELDIFDESNTYVEMYL